MSSAIPDFFYNDRSARGRLTLTGRDRQSFLQGMVTNDVLALTPGAGCYAFLLDPTGHVLADVRVLAAEGYLLLDTEPGMAKFVAETLDRYLIIEKCRIADATEELAQVFVGGARAAEILQALFEVDGLADWREGANASVGLGDTVNAGLLAATRWIPGAGFDIYAPGGLQATLLALLTEAGAAALADDTMEGLRIEAGVPRYGVDIDAKVLAPETGQASRAISYRKGCYIGQEIVARIDARGHANRTLAGFYPSSDTLPVPGAPVEAEGREVGRVTSSTLSAGFRRAIAIGYIRNEFATAGTVVTISRVPAEVASLPFASMSLSEH